MLFTDATAQSVLAEPGQVDGIAFIAEDGVSQRDAGRRPRSRVVGDDVEVDHRRAADEGRPGRVHENIPSFSTFMLIFAGIAMFVGAFIINNTFSITVAQRTKEMAMLRAIGASGRQVMRAVLARGRGRSAWSRRRSAWSPASVWRRC